MSYTHFTLSERKYLQKLLSEDKSFREIARILERSPSSVSREVNRNRAKYKPHRPVDNKYWYNHWRAENLATIRRRDRRRTALVEGTFKFNYVVEKLSLYWSPEQISMRLRMDYPNEKVCSATIYRYLKSGELPKVAVKTHLRRRGKFILPRNTSYNTIQPERIIPEWDQSIKDRVRIGDFEGDTVYGGVGKGLLVTLVDRKSRYLLAGKLHSRNAELTENVIVDLLKNIPVKSISLDNGSEFSRFKEIEKQLNVPIYFAEPHKPWQRGTNENTNDIIRFFFPKGCNFHQISDDEIQTVVDLINTRPRKCLNWKTPKEVFFNECVALA